MGKAISAAASVTAAAMITVRRITSTFCGFSSSA